MSGQHHYGDWIRHTASGKVAVICPGDMKNYLVNVKYVDGRIEKMTIFDYDLITEYEFWKQADPKKCGEPMRSVSDSYSISDNMQEDWFCGGKMKSYFRAKGEDFFG